MKSFTVAPGTLLQIQIKAKQQFGLNAISSRPNELYRKLLWIAKQQHIEKVDDWLNKLALQPWTDSICEQVIPAFTVGETYFRRDPNATEWLTQTFLPQLIAKRRHQQGKRLDCWSAGCCTGEEAYGLLFLINDLHPHDFRINIVATDLNRNFLRQAIAGRYRQGSFRSPAPDFQQRYFINDNNDWVILEKWRNRIQFELLNLMDRKPPQAHTPFDLILCRNVLMYFSQDDACDIIHMYMNNLRKDGVLLLGAVDANLATIAGYSGFWAGDNFAIWGNTPRKLPRSSVTEPLNSELVANPLDKHELPKVQPLSVETVSALASNKRTVPKKHVPKHVTVSPKQRKGTGLQEQLENPDLSRAEKAAICLQLAQLMQHQNRLDDALNWLTEAVSIQPLNSRGQVLLGQHYLFTQQFPLAVAMLQKAIYLDVNNIAAHFYYAQACQHVGRAAAAIKSLQQCLKLLQALDNNQIVEDAAGLSVAHVQKLAEQLIHSGVTYAD